MVEWLAKAMACVKISSEDSWALSAYLSMNKADASQAIVKARRLQVEVTQPRGPVEMKEVPNEAEKVP